MLMNMNNWHKATLLKTINLSPRVKLLTVQGEKVDPIPGQYCSIKVMQNGLFSQEREYSVIETEKKDIIQFAVNLLDTGELSPKLHALKKGDEISISGPKGTHFLLNGNEQSYVCIAGGTGIAPFIGLLRNNRKMIKPKHITLLASFKSKADYLFQDELAKTDEYTKVIVTLTQGTPDNWTQLQGRINLETLIKVVNGEVKDSTRFYICGGSIFVENMRNLLTTMKIPEEKINYERFG